MNKDHRCFGLPKFCGAWHGMSFRRAEPGNSSQTSHMFENRQQQRQTNRIETINIMQLKLKTTQACKAKNPK